MLDLYGVRSPQREALIQLGRDARKRGWWTAYADVFTGSYIGLESEAATIRINAHVVPGLLQTAGYARAVISQPRPALEPGAIERAVAARAARQQAILDRDNPPDIHVILDEAALRRQAGGPAVLSGQLTALAQASARPNVAIQVLPFTAGANAGMDGKFVILTFPSASDPPVAYVEGLMGDIYLESEAELDRYNLAWTHLITQALEPGESVALVSELAEESR